MSALGRKRMLTSEWHCRKMRTHLQFRSSSFPAFASEYEEINPGVFGKRLADYLASALPSFGLHVERIDCEDWGWRIDLRNEGFPLWIGCSNYSEYSDGFLCQIIPSKPYVWRWFKKVPTVETVERVAKAIEAALAAHGNVHALRWWDESEVG